MFMFLNLCDIHIGCCRGSPQSMPLVPWFRGHKVGGSKNDAHIEVVVA